MGAVLIRLLSIFALLASAAAGAPFPPKGFVVYEDSASPNGRYAILIPTADSVDLDNVTDTTNYLADLQAKRVLGKIRGADYFEHANHRGLRVVWAPDSSWCLLEYDGRFAFGALVLLEIEGASFRQMAIEERVNTLLERELKKQKSEGLASSSIFVRAGQDRKLRLRAVADDNPKRFDDRRTHCALFQGTYDLAARKWTITDARTISLDDDEMLASAYEPFDGGGRVFENDQQRFDALDEKLNSVYKALRLLLPTELFASVKKEQKAWLEAQPKNAPAGARGVAWSARIEVLERLLW